jgi:glycosyltransferase involved in cell wall biosynthesis
MSEPGRLLVAYDFLATLGGAERVTLMLAQQLGASVIVGYDAGVDTGLGPGKVRTLRHKRLRNRYLNLLSVLSAFVLARPPRDVDSVIVSGIYAVFLLPRLRGRCRTVAYCHTPPRFCHEDFELYFGRLGRMSRTMARMATGVFAKAYARCMASADVVYSNSNYTRRRLLEHHGVESAVLYPPSLDVLHPPAERRLFYFSCARHESYKRVHFVIEAFRSMPDKPLVVASEGSQTLALMHLANGCRNIRFVGAVDDREMSRLLGSAIASIYVPQGEDFGMTPIESMRHGTPVIGVAEGGLLETVTDGRDGCLIQGVLDAGAIRDAVLRIDAEAQARMAGACRSKAALFESATFFAEIQRAASVDRCNEPAQM